MNELIKTLAVEARNCFENKIRDNGNRFWCLKDGSPQWVQDLMYYNHRIDGILPNDYVYQFTLDALDLFIETINYDDDIETAISEIEPDPYNYDLIKWISNNDYFQIYCNDAIKEFQPKEFYNILSIAQALHKQAIANSTLRFLKGKINE